MESLSSSSNLPFKISSPSRLGSKIMTVILAILSTTNGTTQKTGRSMGTRILPQVYQNYIFFFLLPYNRKLESMGFYQERQAIVSQFKILSKPSENYSGFVLNCIDAIKTINHKLSLALDVSICNVEIDKFLQYFNSNLSSLVLLNLNLWKKD